MRQVKNIYKQYLNEFSGRRYLFDSFLEYAKDHKVDYRWIITEKQEKQPPRLYESNIKEVYYYQQGGSNEELPWYILGKTKDGLYFLLEGWCNYSGFDSYGSFRIYVSTNLQNMLLYGISESIRNSLIY